MANVRAQADERRTVGVRLRELRKSRGKTTMDVAIALGMTQGNYEAYESGRNSIRLEMLRAFAGALALEPHELHDALYPVRESSTFDRWCGAAMQMVTGTPAPQPA